MMVGIYKITNLDNGKMYVGQSTNIEKRWDDHKLLLNKNQHSNLRLQYSWNAHGEDRFDFSILEECDIDELNDLEIYWVDKLRTYVGFDDCNGYNETIGGDGNRRFTKEYVKPVCDLYNSGKFKTVPKLAEYLGWQQKRVRRHLVYGQMYGLCEYDPSTKGVEAHIIKVICLNNFKVFDSVKDAEEYYNIHGVACCCLGQHKYAGRDENNKPLLWMYFDLYEKMTSEEVDDYINKLNNNIYSMYVVRLNDGVIFENSVLAAKDVGLKTQNSIHKCCNRKSKYAGKDKETGEHYVWAYYKDYIKLNKEEIQDMLNIGQITTTNPPKRVICLNNLMVFDNPTEASEWAVDTNQQLIKNCCINSTNSAGKHPDDNSFLTWMYYDDYKTAEADFIKNKILLSEYKRSTPDKMKKIVCLNNLYLFKGQAEAAQWCGLKNMSMIGYSAKRNKVAGKHPDTNESLRWMFYEDYIKEYNEDTLVKYQGV